MSLELLKSGMSKRELECCSKKVELRSAVGAFAPGGVELRSAVGAFGPGGASCMSKFDAASKCLCLFLLLFLFLLFIVFCLHRG